ncbi:hypothetical protein Aduo_002682 [Ancylostoma duodenale]
MEHINISSIIGVCMHHLPPHFTVIRTRKMKRLALIGFLTFCSLLSAEEKGQIQNQFPLMPSPACRIICSLTLKDYTENVTSSKIEEVPKWCNNYYKLGNEQEKKMVDEKCPKICDELKSALEEDKSLRKRLIKGRRERLQYCEKYNV